MVAAILRGLQRYLRDTGHWYLGDVGTVCCEEPDWEEDERTEEEAYDDVSGAQLDPEMVRRAREEEMKEVKALKIYEKVLISLCLQITKKKPTGIKWVEINKGGFENPEYQSRLVARELRYTEIRNHISASTPLLEALRFLLSLCMTRRRLRRAFRRGRRTRKIRFLDASRAHFHADALRDVFIDLPDEDI